MTDSNQSIFSTDGEVLQEPRLPLASITSSSTNIPTSQLRRKTSVVVRVDSSEDIPSPHASIFEAFCTSPRSSDEGANGMELVTLDKDDTLGTNLNQTSDENRRFHHKPEIIVIDTTEFLYGHGTVLDTITEQKSYGTLQASAKENSTENLPNFPFVRHRDSFVLGQTPRRKQAFSLDDIALIQSSYHEACAMIERETQRQSPAPEIYAEPRNPLHAPFERPTTPEGMPSWTSSQNISGESQPIQPRRSSGRFRRLLGLSSQPVVPSVNGRSVSDPIRGRQAPRFRPPRSVYGLINQHPFNNAPIARVVQPSTPIRKSTLKGNNRAKAKVPLQVRFTPSATARDSEIIALCVAIESTSASAPHPIFDPPLSPIVTIKCPHAKGRIALAKSTHSLNHINTNPPSNEYVTSLISLNPDQSMGTPWPSRAVSPSPSVSVISTAARSEESGFRQRGTTVDPLCISSTTHLMSGALIQSQPGFIPLHTKPTPKTKEPWCWKCKAQAAVKKADHFRVQSTSCLCFVFCGYDTQDDASCVEYSSADGSRIRS